MKIAFIAVKNALNQIDIVCFSSLIINIAVITVIITAIFQETAWNFKIMF